MPPRRLGQGGCRRVHLPAAPGWRSGRWRGGIEACEAAIRGQANEVRHPAWSRRRDDHRDTTQDPGGWRRLRRSRMRSPAGTQTVPRRSRDHLGDAVLLPALPPPAAPGRLRRPDAPVDRRVPAPQPPLPQESPKSPQMPPTRKHQQQQAQSQQPTQPHSSEHPQTPQSQQPSTEPAPQKRHSTTLTAGA